MTVEQMRGLMLLWQAKSAVTQCCGLLGEQVCNDMLHDIDVAAERIRHASVA